MPEIISYPSLQEQLRDTPPFSNIDTSIVTTIYEQTGFPKTAVGKHAYTVFVRGSTASGIQPDGTLIFRNLKSDIDIVVMHNRLTDSKSTETGYAITPHVVFTQPSGDIEAREVDILYADKTAVDREQRNPHRSFLTTKIVQPGVPFVAPDKYVQEKAQAIEVFSIRHAGRTTNPESAKPLKLTPSGTASLAIQEDLWNEPWRFLSYRTYFNESPRAHIQRKELTTFAEQMLRNLVSEGKATDITGQFQNHPEPIFELDKQIISYSPNTPANRMRDIGSFVFDQLAILRTTPGGLTRDNVARVMMKLRSFMQNSRLRYDVGIIFGE